MTHASLDITVLAGGPSRERDVSSASGRAVAQALEHAGHRVRLADIDPDHLDALDDPGDVVFIALHGRFGEDGQLQQILEDRGIAYCGSSPQACRRAADKWAAKTLFVEHDIPTPKYDIVRAAGDMAAALACWTLPIVVKPVTEGSSIGTTIVEHAEPLRGVVADTLERFGPVLIEQYVAGKELTVGILTQQALPLVEIRPEGRFYDYHAKYESDSTQYVFDLDIPAPLVGRIQDLSVRAASVLGMRDFCRADWLLDDQNNPHLLEINAIPGFTGHSLLPKAAAKAGLAMPALCDRIVRAAAERAVGACTASNQP